MVYHARRNVTVYMYARVGGRPPTAAREGCAKRVQCVTLHSCHETAV